MKKKLFICLLCFVSIICVVGCDIVKKSLTKEEFSKIAEKHDLIIIDVLEQFADYPELKSATLAANSDGWQIEFYTLDTNENAKKMFEKNKAAFQSLKTNGSRDTMVEVGNYTKYTLDSDSYHMVAAKVGNTFLYVKVPLKYKKDADAVIKDMGY